MDGFDEWYKPKQETLKNDPVCQHIVELRNEIIKEGKVDTVSYVRGDIDFGQIESMRPSWADGTFIGGKYGGAGFYVERPDGTEKEFYVDLELDDVEYGMYFEETQSSDEPIFDNIADVEDDLIYYVRILGELVSDARDEFGQD